MRSTARPDQSPYPTARKAGVNPLNWTAGRFQRPVRNARTGDLLDWFREGSRPTSPRSVTHRAGRSLPGSGRRLGPARPPPPRPNRAVCVPQRARHAAATASPVFSACSPNGGHTTTIARCTVSALSRRTTTPLGRRSPRLKVASELGVWVEPPVGIEPTTFSLRGGRSPSHLPSSGVICCKGPISGTCISHPCRAVRSTNGSTPQRPDRSR